MDLNLDGFLSMAEAEAVLKAMDANSKFGYSGRQEALGYWLAMCFCEPILSGKK